MDFSSVKVYIISLFLYIISIPIESYIFSQIYDFTFFEYVKALIILLILLYPASNYYYFSPKAKFEGILKIVFWIFNLFYLIPFIISLFFFRYISKQKTEINNFLSFFNESILTCKDNIIDLKNYEEDTISRKIRDNMKPLLSHLGISISTQSETGYSATKKPKTQGKGDLILSYQGKTLTIIEAIRIKSNKQDNLIIKSNKDIESHFEKLIKNYNQIALPTLFFFVYLFNSQDIDSEWENLLKILKKIKFQNKTPKFIEELTVFNNIDIKIKKIAYNMNLKDLTVYCYLIPFNTP